MSSQNRIWESYSQPKKLSRISQSGCKELHCDILVIGLGASGLSACIHAQSQGYSVIGIDMKGIGGGAAGANGGFLLAGYDECYHHDIQRLGQEQAKIRHQQTIDELRVILNEYKDITRQVGSLRLACDDKEKEEYLKQCESMQKDGFDVEWYEGEEGQGFFTREDAVVDPLKRVNQMSDKALQIGCRLFQQAKAVSIEGNRVETEQGVTILCKKVIVAVDCLDQILPELSSKVYSVKLHMIATEPAHDVHFPIPIHRYDDYWIQFPTKEIILGGFHQTENSEECWDLIEQFLREKLKTKAKITHRWGEYVGFAKEFDPICEEVREGVFAIGAYTGIGNVIGTLYGKKAAQWAIDRINFK